MALSRHRAIAVTTALGLLLLGTAFVDTARAAHVHCGQVITESVSLDSDVGPCPQDGLIVAASGITINLRQFRILGANNADGTAGIRLRHVNKVTVTNGTIENFDSGVVIGNGSQNTIRGLRLTGIGNSPACELGDGIVAFGSNNNIIQDNEVLLSGPFSGISVVGVSSGNLIRNNRVHDNVVHFPCGNFQTIGIRLEGPGATSNVVSGNRVDRNGFHGIHVHGTFEDERRNANNTIANNYVSGNGALFQGDGISLGLMGQDPINNTVEANTVRDNFRDGIHVKDGSINNTITKNEASGNGRYDGADLNPNCDNNIWRANVLAKVNQPCVLGSR